MKYLKILTLCSISVWLGVMGFFSFLGAPVVFTSADRESAGRLIGALLPRYYLFGITMEALALLGLLGRMALKRARGLEWGAFALVLLMLALSAYSMLGLLPQAERARLAMRSAAAAGSLGSEAALAFGRAHGLAVALNLLTMLAGLTLLVVEALRTRWER